MNMPPIRGNDHQALLGSGQSDQKYRRGGSPPDTPPPPVDYPRRRAAIACEVCRARKSRCDGAKPKCGFCKEINHDCHYRPAPAAPPSKFLLLELALTDRLERDIGRILHKMDNIEHNTSFQNRFHPMAIVTPPDSDHGSPHNIGDNRRFPLQLGSFAPRPRVPEETNALAFRRDLVEAATSSDVCLPRDLHRAASLPYIFAEFFKHERESPKIPFEIHYVHALPPNDFHVVGSLPVVTEQEIDTLFESYFTKVHCWFPFLEPASCKQQFLLIMALGAMAKDDCQTEQNLAIDWARPAFEFLFIISLQGKDITAIQCLLLFSLYQMWLLKPAHAYDLLLQASTKLQVILYHRVLDMDNTTAEDREMETRAFWALVMMENEYRGLYGHPGSGIEAYEDVVGFPYSEASPFPMDQQYQKLAYFFLGMITMRRTLNRGKYTRHEYSSDSDRIKFNVASALEEELNQWYRVVPGDIQFDPFFDLPDTFYLAPKIEDNIAWLRSSAAACPTIFYWHAAFNAATTNALFLGREYRDGLEKHLLGFMRYVSSACQYLDGRFNPMIWSQAQNLYIGSVSAIVILESPVASKFAPPALVQYVEKVMNILETYSRYSESLGSSFRAIQMKLQQLRATGKIPAVQSR